MPRRAGGGRSGGIGRRPAPALPRYAPAPPTPQQTAPPPMIQQRTGLFGQMAATAGGVAIGSTVGHAVGHAMTGGGRDESVAQAPAEQQPVNYQQQSAPCQFEMRDFFECTQRESDLSMCEGFNRVLKECRARLGGKFPS